RHIEDRPAVDLRPDQAAACPDVRPDGGAAAPVAERHAERDVDRDIEHGIVPEIVLCPEEARAVADFQFSADHATPGPARGPAERAATLVGGARELAARPQVD